MRTVSSILWSFSHNFYFAVEVALLVNWLTSSLNALHSETTAGEWINDVKKSSTKLKYLLWQHHFNSHWHMLLPTIRCQNDLNFEVFIFPSNWENGWKRDMKNVWSFILLCTPDTNTVLSLLSDVQTWLKLPKLVSFHRQWLRTEFVSHD